LERFTERQLVEQNLRVSSGSTAANLGIGLSTENQDNKKLSAL